MTFYTVSTPAIKLDLDVSPLIHIRIMELGQGKRIVVALNSKG
jgi:hypothetical protein